MAGRFKRQYEINECGIETLEASCKEFRWDSAYLYSNPWIKEECTDAHNEATKMLKQTCVEKITAQGILHQIRLVIVTITKCKS